MKAIRSKFGAAIDSGRKSGHGRVVLLFFDICQDIRGGSPATTTIPTGIETIDIDEYGLENTIPCQSPTSIPSTPGSQPNSTTRQLNTPSTRPNTPSSRSSTLSTEVNVLEED